MTLRQSITALTTAAIVVGFMSIVNLNAQTGGGGASIAVVSIADVFEKLDERNAIQAEIQTMVDKAKKWQQEKGNDIKMIQEDLRIMDKNSPNYRATVEDFERKALQLQVELKFREQNIEREKAIKLEALYRKILAGIESVAQVEGYDLVISKDRTPSLRGANQQQIVFIIDQRKNLYSNSSLDITQRVEQKLNNDFKNNPTPADS